MTHEKYLEIFKNNKKIFGKNIGQLDTEHLYNKIKEAIFLSSKCYSYICKDNIPDNENMIKNNIIHTKGISDSYSKKYIDHNIFKETLINNINQIKSYSIQFK